MGSIMPAWSNSLSRCSRSAAPRALVSGGCSKSSLILHKLRSLRFIHAQLTWDRHDLGRLVNALLMILLGLSPLPVVADTVAVEVKSLDVEITSERRARVNARLMFHLSDDARQAVLHGVPLYWRAIVQWRKQRRYWWDKVLLEKEIRLKLQYHALLNQFSIQRDKAEAEMFSTLEDALQQMGRLRLRLDRMEGGSMLSADYIAIKVVFERNALPTPLQPEAWLDKQWDLSSDWSLWPIQK